jgi:hypothetical protein
MQVLRITLCAFALAAFARPDRAAEAPPPAEGHVIHYAPTLSAAALRGRPDGDVVEFANGRQVRLGDLRRLTAFAGRLRTAPMRPLPAALSTRPAAGGTRINDANQLAAALARPDSDTLELPSGRRLTVAQLKFLQPQIEKEIGRRLDARAPARAAIEVDARTDWKRILQMPDDTLLEAPDGTRVSVADIKRALREPALPRATGAP